MAMEVSPSLLEEIHEARSNLRTDCLTQLCPQLLAQGSEEWLWYKGMNVSEAEGAFCSWKKVGRAALRAPFQAAA